MEFWHVTIARPLKPPRSGGLPVGQIHPGLTHRAGKQKRLFRIPSKYPVMRAEDPTPLYPDSVPEWLDDTDYSVLPPARIASTSGLSARGKRISLGAKPRFAPIAAAIHCAPDLSRQKLAGRHVNQSKPHPITSTRPTP